MKVTLTNDGTTLKVLSPYNAAFVDGARKAGGRWVPPNWEFHPADVDVVRQLCRDFYGEDGSGAPPDVVSIEIEWKRDGAVGQGRLLCCGRVIAQAFGRDSGAKLGDGVVLLNGRFSSGGSMKNWTTTVAQGTRVRLHDIPRHKAEALVASNTDADSNRIYTIVGQPALTAPAAEPTERERLTAERVTLLARIAEIDLELAKPEPEPLSVLNANDDLPAHASSTF